MGSKRAASRLTALLAACLLLLAIARPATGAAPQAGSTVWLPLVLNYDGMGKLVFASDRSPGCGLWTIRGDGSRLTRIALSQCGDRDPAWSPDGTKIVFARVNPADNHYHLYILDMAANTLRLITSGDADDSEPAWSPDGSRIVFTRSYNNGTELWQVERNEYLTVGRLTDSPSDERQAAWAPQGDALAYTMLDASVDPFYRSEDVVLCQLSSGTLTYLVNSSAIEHQPAWSPDGQTIAFTGNASGVMQLYVIRADDSADAVQLTTLTRDAHEPAWAPDNSALYLSYSIDSEGHRNLYRFDLSTRVFQRLTNGTWVDAAPDAWPKVSP